MINDETELQATSAETGASVQNIQQLVAGDYDVAFSLADTATDAVNGDGDFDGAQEVSTLGRIYSNYTQVVVSADSGIDSVEDFAGKRISTGSPLSGTEVIANRMIEAAGLARRRRVGAAARPDQDRRRHEGRVAGRFGVVRRPADPGR